MQELKVHYFASARDAARTAQETWKFVPGETLGGLRLRLVARHPDLVPLLPSCRFAIGDDFAAEDECPQPGAQIYVLPPVSGGAGAPPMEQRTTVAMVVNRRLEVGESARALRTSGAGAIVTFTGVVRDHNQGHAVTQLEFEAHQSLAQKELERIVHEAKTRFGLSDARAVHRLGPCALGEPVVDIAVAGAHRAETFEGCRFIIDELKKTVPIWKRESRADGDVWVTPTP